MDKDLELSVIDVMGRVVHSAKIEAGSTSYTLNTSNLLSGIYTYRLLDGANVLVFNKLVVVGR